MPPRTAWASTASTAAPAIHFTQRRESLIQSARGENDRQDSYGAGNHAVAMLKFDAAHHARHAEAAEGSRPVRHGKACVVTGHQRARDNQKKSAKRDKHCVAM